MTAARLRACQRRAAVTLVGTSVMISGTPAEMMDALQAVGAEERTLLRRRAFYSVSMCQVRTCRALILARFGCTERAEKIMAAVLPCLAGLEARREWEWSARALLWIVGRGQRPGRALYLARKMGVEAPEEPAADDGRPTGF